VRTYAPRGRTPVLRVRLTRDHLSVISGVTPDGKLLVIWDGASIHRGQPIKDFLAAGAAHRLRLEVLPGYAPDLNPLDQGVWQHLKHVELANVCCTDLRHLRRELHGAVKRLRQKPHIIRGCIRHAGYHL